MSLQKILPPALAIVFGIVNGVYVFKPYLDSSNELPVPEPPKISTPPPETPKDNKR